MPDAIKSLTVRVGEPSKDLAGETGPAPTIKVVGRTAWMLDALIRAGVRGCTSLENPAPRVADYIFKLRGKGIVVETIDEKHAGAYRGVHARYVLRSPVTVLEETRA